MSNRALLDKNTDQFVGDIIELSEAGMMVQSTAPLPVNRVFHLKMPAGENLFFKARTVWCNRLEESEGHYASGFQILGENEISRRSLKRVLAMLLR